MTRKAPLTPFLLVGVFTILFIGGTLLLAFNIFTEPRSTLVLAGITFVCWVELLLGIMIGAFLVKGYFGNGFSGAITAILVKVTTLYGLIGIITIAAFAFFPETPERDNLFGATIFFESVLFFAAGTALIYFDSRYQADQNRVLTQREQHTTKSYDIAGILSSMRNVKTEDPDTLSQLHSLMKKLETAEQCLAHSHGGGLSSEISDFKTLDAQIFTAVDNLNRESLSLVNNDSEISGDAILKMEKNANDLHSVLARAKLL